MSPHPPETRRRAAELVGAGAPYQQAADELRVAKKTVTRWMQEEQFREVARVQRQESLEPTALGVLRDLLWSDNESIRLRAAAPLIEKPELEAELAAESADPTVSVFGGDLDG